MKTALERMTMSESGYLFNPETGSTFLTNQTGLAILQAIKDGWGFADVVEAIASAFAVSPIEAERDVIDFMDLLRARGVLA